MRRFLIPLLLVSSAASPALAAPRDHPDREQTRSERQESKSEGQQQQRSEARSERSVERSGGQDRPQFTGSRRGNDGTVNQSQRMVRSNQGGGEQQAQESRRSSGRFRTAQPGSGEPSQTQVIERQRDAPDSVTNWRRHERRAGDTAQTETIVRERRQGEDVRRSERQVQSETRTRVPIVSRVPREGTQPPLRAERRRTEQVRWSSSHWRKDRRYNWQDWRRRHRSHFHLGFYFDPFGWGYQRYSIGWRLWPSYYSSRYWLNDPWSYRLPYAPPGYRWIRYYDDALLVDTWTGEVVDVIYNFFW